MRKLLMALTEFLILRKLRSGCLEGRTTLIQPILNSFTRSKADALFGPRQAPASALFAGMTGVRRERRRSMGHETAFDGGGFDRFLQLFEGAHLDLAHSLARDAVLLREIL
jgi:hypothetical protein